MGKQSALKKLSTPGFVKNILIVRQHNQLGDMLCSVPLFESLRTKFPDASITLVASPMNYQILFTEINPFINEVLVYEKRPVRKISSFFKQLRSKKYQLGVVPSTVAFSRTSHIINYLSGAPVRVGAAVINGKRNKAGYLLNISGNFDWDNEHKHQIERNLDIGRLIGCDLHEDSRNIKLVLNKEELEYGRKYIETNFDKEPVIALHPGAGKIPNQWNVKKFFELIKMFSVRGYKNFLITSGKIDKEITNELKSLLESESIKYSIPDNNGIRNEAAILKHVSVYITNDTGMMHVAAGVDAKIVSLFGPTNGYEWAPHDDTKVYIQSESGNINDIKVEDVFNKAIEIISK